MTLPRLYLLLAIVLLSGCAPTGPDGTDDDPAFHIELTPEVAREMADLGLDVPVVGRVYVILTRDGTSEPRRQVGVRGVPFWGRDVRDFGAGDAVALTPGSEGVLGYPLNELAEVPPGEYLAQAFLNVFTTLNRADGHTVEMHLNSGAGQSPMRAPGNAMSAPTPVTIGPGGLRPHGTGSEGVGSQGAPLRLTLSRVIPPTHPVPAGGSLQQGNPADRGELVRFRKILSPSLSAFWGRDMYIGANILLPAGYHENPEQRYPVLYLTGHFPGDRAPFGYTDGEDGGRGRNAGFSEFWRSPEAPELILVSVRDANPYYDTGHSVNSANVGPYGDAFTRELIPALEDEFRMIPEGWARLLAGGSTGGWEALAVQIFNPADFGGAWGWCPDPVDFHDYQLVNVYEDENAYTTGSEWVKVERPNNRRVDGTVVSTIRQEMQYERAVGPNGRSGGQWAIWEALFSPVGPDGYAAPIWDRVTGEIDPEVADYWREHWDLTHHLVTRWNEIGPDLAGKLHVAVGDMDSYYLNNAVRRMQAALDTLQDPAPRARFEYGRRKPHCWIGASPWRDGEDLTSVEFVRVVDAYLDRVRRGG